LFGWTDAVRRELRGDHAIDRPAVGFGQVGEPPQEGLVEHAGAGGYHLNGMLTVSASCPRARSSATSVSAISSAPP